MSFIPSFPGVYLREIPSGSRSIVGASTSVAAFIGRFARGPIDTPVRMFSMADFESNFGGVDGGPASFAVSQFFLNGGGKAYAVRADNGAAPASVTMRGQTGSTAMLRATAGSVINTVLTPNPGTWGNALRLDVDYRTSDPANLFNLVVSEVRIKDGISQAVRTEVFRNLSMAAAANNAIAVVNDGSAQIMLDQGGPTDLPQPDRTPVIFRHSTSPR